MKPTREELERWKEWRLPDEPLHQASAIALDLLAENEKLRDAIAKDCRNRAQEFQPWWLSDALWRRVFAAAALSGWASQGKTAFHPDDDAKWIGDLADALLAELRKREEGEAR